MTITPDLVHSAAFANSLESIRFIPLENGNHLQIYVTRPLDDAGNPQNSQIAARVFDPTGTSVIGNFDVTEPSFDYGNPHDFEVVATEDGVALAYLAENEFGNKAVWLGEIDFDATGDHSIKHTMIEPFQLHPIKSPSISYQPGEPGTPAHVQVNWTFEEGNNFGVEGRSVALGDTNTIGARETLSSSGLGPTSDEGLESVSAALTGGNHVVVSTTGSTTTLIPDALKFRIVDETGDGVSFSKGVGNTASNFEIDDQPAVAALNDGGFVVAWRNNDGGVATEIQMARYDDQGVQKGTVQTIPVDPGIEYSEPEWVLMPNGNLGLAWLEHGGAHSQVGFSAVNINSGAFAQTGPIHKIVSSNHPIADLSLDAAPDGRILVSALFDEDPSGELPPANRSFFFDTAGLLIVGKAGKDDVLVAREAHSVVYGDGFSGGPAGNDTLYAFGEGDELRGGKGRDLLISGDGVDTLDGGDGADVLISGDEADILKGGKGDDLLVSGKEANTLDGGDGYDTVSYENSTYGVTVWLGDDQPGAPALPDPDGGDANGDVLVSVEALIGSDRGDQLFGALNGGSTLKGGGGVDYFRVSGGGNRVEGGDGGDTFFESLEAPTDGDADLFLAGDGNDVILVGRGLNTVEGGDGDDTINLVISRAVVGGQAVEFDSQNFVDGGDGFDTVNYLGAPAAGIDMDLSQDRVVRERGVDIVTNVERFYGTSHADKMLGDGDENTLYGDRGDDLIEGRGGKDSLDGGHGDDTIAGGSGRDTLYGGDGDDDVRGGNGSDKVVLGAGADVFTDNGQSGANGGDTVSGGDGNDVILGRGGDDVLSGNDGTDSIEGGEGADTIAGGSGHDTIRAGADDDDVRGGNGRDKVFLGHGDDLFTDNDQSGENGGDTVYGGAGNDVILGRGGDDVLSGDDGDDVIEGGEGADTISGGSDNDTISGGAGDDELRGGTGRDVISGGANNDTLAGGGGRDEISGGEDDDVLTGGQGADTFVFLLGHGADVITDFELGVDHISIDGTLIDLGNLGPEITATRDGADTVLNYGLDGDEIRLEDALLF